MKILARMTRVSLVVVMTLSCSMTGSAPLADGSRLQVKVDEPFEIGGIVYPAGRLTVKTLRDYTPSTTLNELWVGNTCLGMFVTRISGEESSDPTDESIVFTRDYRGRLVLVGYAFVGSRDDRTLR